MYLIASDAGIEREYVNPSKAYLDSLTIDSQQILLCVLVGGVILLACVLVIYGVFYLSVIGRIHQFGIRSGEKQEFDWAKSGHTDFHPFLLDGLSEALEAIGDAPVYFTVDLDVMDPSVFPGTGTPEPGGVDFLTLMRAVTEVCGKVNLIGCDVNELCPPCDPTGASTAAACKIIREMLIAALER